MEPISGLASVVALVETASKLSRLLRKTIATIKNAPDVLLALNNEISDLHLMLDDVNDLLLASTTVSPPRSLVSALERVKSTVLGLESFIAYELTVIDSTGNTRLDKSTFLRKEQRVQQLKDQVRNDNIVLGAALNLFASFRSIHHDSQLRQTHVSIEKLQNRLDDLHIDHQSRRAAGHDGHELAVTKRVQEARVPHVPVSIQVFRAPVCDAGCPCRCHSLNRIRSPAILSNIVGTLFVGYRANVSLWQARSAPCLVSCQSRVKGTVCTYTFPSWMLKYVVSMSYSSISSKGPELNLRLMRVRDLTSTLSIMKSSSEAWSVGETKRMLDTGLMSVLDVDDKGRTILHHAIRHSRWLTAGLLISYGADVNYEDHNFVSPFSWAWFQRIQSKNPGDVSENWKHLSIQEHSQWDFFGQSALHAAYWEVGQCTFEQALAQTERSNMDCRDSLGFTVLHWAVLRGDASTVRQLLTMGADPNTQSKWGTTPLHVAVVFDASVAGLLLDAKADPKLVSNEGRTPLHSVQNRAADLVHRLITLGMDVDQVDNSGQTALDWACWFNQHEVVRELLCAGANTSGSGKNVRPKVYEAVKQNNHQTLSVLLTHPSIELSETDDSGWNIPVTALFFGDIQTLQVLRDDWPAEAEFGMSDTTQAQQMWAGARSRRDQNEHVSRQMNKPPDPDPLAWFDAFEDVMNTIRTKREGFRQRITNDIPTTHNDDNDDNDDGGEIWEDAREQHNDL